MARKSIRTTIEQPEEQLSLETRTARPDPETRISRLYTATPEQPRLQPEPVLERHTLLLGYPPVDELSRPPIRPYERFNSKPHPFVRPETTIYPNLPVRTQLYTYGPPPALVVSKLLSDMIKIYSTNSKKYGGEEDEVLDILFQVFYDCCTKVGLPENMFYLVYSIMLKGKASSFYFDKIAGRKYDF